MKYPKIILLLILLVVFSNNNLNAQNNFFIKDGARWVYKVLYGNTNLGLQIDENYQHKIYNDTTVDNTTYKLLGTAIKTTTRTINTTENYTCETYSLLRYDSINKLMYHKEFSDTIETILYDFNMQIGDTIKLKRLSSSFDSNPKNTISVDSIFKISVGNDSVKVFTLADTLESGQLESFIIEGFGSYTGLLWHNQKYISVGDVYFNSELIYYENDNTEFKFEPIYTANNKIELVSVVTVATEIFIDCILDVSSIQHNEIKVYPNPTESILNISTSETEHNLTFQMFDILGNIKIESKISNNSNNAFDITRFSSGIYYYTISNEYNIYKNGRILIR